MTSQQKLMNRAYPKESSRDFYARIRQNWLNLKAEKVIGPDYYASKLYRELKPKRDTLPKFTAFIMYICLCLNRPWENEWERMSFSDGKCRGEEDIWAKIEDILEKIKEIQEDFPPYPDPRILRKIEKKRGFKLIVHWIAVDLKPLYKPVRKSLFQLKKKWRSVGEEISEKLKNIGSSRIRYLISEDPKFLDTIIYLNSQRNITKRDLYRKLRVNSRRCDSILNEAKEKGLVRTKETTNKTVWITYTGTED